MSVEYDRLSDGGVEAVVVASSLHALREDVDRDEDEGVDGGQAELDGVERRRGERRGQVADGGGHERHADARDEHESSGVVWAARVAPLHVGEAGRQDGGHGGAGERAGQPATGHRVDGQRERGEHRDDAGGQRRRGGQAAGEQ